jgi:hypothetical protein
MSQRLFRLWMVLSRPPCDEDFDSACGRFEADICFATEVLRSKLRQLLTSRLALK